MPACLAHYLFGQDILGRLAEDLRKAVLAYKNEYALGLQGPDIFYFHQPYRRNRISDYGRACHNRPAEQLFAPVLETVHENAALSCLIGLICHYVLDKCCHPYINGHSREPRDHQRIESAFDKFMMGCCGPVQARYQYIPVSGMDYGALAALWPEMGASTIRKCAVAERRSIRFLDRVKLLRAWETVLGRPGALTPLSLPEEVSGPWAEHARCLYDLYTCALEEGAVLVRRAVQAMGTGIARLSGFELNFKGEVPE